MPKIPWPADDASKRLGRELGYNFEGWGSLHDWEAMMALKTLTEDQVVVIRDAPVRSVGASGASGSAKGTDGGSDADPGTGGTSNDRGTSDHSADSDSSTRDRGESGSTTTPTAPDSSDRAASQPR